MDTILKATDLRKNYLKKRALNGVNIELKKGKILGLLGPNGSGKTTFIKIAAGILRSTSGELLIDGQAPGVYTKSIVSYLPDVNYLFKWMKIKDAVDFFNDFYSDFSVEKSKSLLEFMKLNEDDKITSLSKGMLEKLNLALVLSREAKLYIFDEPLGGVDPATRDIIIDAIIKNCNEDTSMIITTHLVRDIERLFDDVAFIFDGEIIIKGDAEELRTKSGKSIDELFREAYQNV